MYFQQITTLGVDIVHGGMIKVPVPLPASRGRRIYGIRVVPVLSGAETASDAYTGLVM